MQIFSYTDLQVQNHQANRLSRQKLIMSSETEEKDILMIMEMFGMDYQQASEALTKYNQNLEKTIELLVKKQSYSPQISDNQIYYPSVSKNKQKQITSASIHAQKMRQMHKKSLVEQKQLTTEKLRQRFKTNYLIKKKNKSKSFKKLQQDLTIKRLQKYLNQPAFVNFFEQNNDVFNELWNTRKFIAVHCLQIPQMSNPKDLQEGIKRNFYTQIYCSQKFGTIFNKQFLNIIVDPSSQDFKRLKVINNFIKPKDNNCIIILRLSQKTKIIVRTSSVNMMSCLKISSPESFQKFIIHLRRDINREIQTEICPSIQHNPISDIQKIKLDGDRKIKAQQETAYKMMEQQLLESKKLQNKQGIEAKRKQLKRRRKSSQSQDEEIKRMKQQVMKSVQQSIVKQRQEKLKQMKKYTPEEIQNAITLKIRFPNGKQIQLILPNNETLQYVVNYITWQEEDLGFQNQLRRNFVFTQPWGLIDFDGMQNKTFFELFNDSLREILIVKQIY